MTGYIQYLQFTAGTNKGGVAQGDVFNDPFKLGQMTDSRVDYTSSAVVENFTGDGTATTFTVTWTPVASVAKVTVAGTAVEVASFDAATGVVTLASAPAASAEVKIAYTYDNVVIPQNDLPILNARMQGIALEAKARRIAIYYSQMAA